MIHELNTFLTTRGRQSGYRRESIRTVRAGGSSPCEDFDDSITSSTDNPAPVSAPHYRADPFASHESMACDLLSAAALFQGPETKACIMTRRNQFSSIRRQR